MTRFIKHNFLWILFLLFSVYAIETRKDEFIFSSTTPYGFWKAGIWALFFLFLGYSLFSSYKENFFKSVVRISDMFWGWQIGIDLYIGVGLMWTVIFFHGGLSVFLVWIIPVLIYANLATLLYIALNFDSLINHFGIL